MIHLSFAKDIYVIGGEMSKNGQKMAKLKDFLFWTLELYQSAQNIS